MKLKNKLLPIVALSGIATVATPLVVSCTNSGIAGSVFEITDGGILKGFKYGVTTSQIEKEFGDTLTIPKDVKYIVPYAFCNGEKSTIPASIKHFKFEDEYECKTIGEYAFAYAPFEDVTITCERNQPDGDPHAEMSYWELKPDAWGLRSIGDAAFMQTENLKTVHLAGTLSHNIGAGAFASYDAGGAVNSKIEMIDYSDFVLSDSVVPEELVSDIYGTFGIKYVGDSTTGWTGTLCIRYSDDGLYGPIISGDGAKLAYLNQWTAFFGADPYTSLDPEVIHKLGTAQLQFWGEPV